MRFRPATLLVLALPVAAGSDPSRREDPPEVWAQPAPGVPRLTRFSHAVIQRWGADYIRISYYIDAEGLRKRGALDPVSFLRSGKVWSATHLTFLTGISPEKRREVFDGQFKRLWPGGRFNPRSATVQQFFDATARRLERGSELEYLLDPAGAVLLRHGREPWTRVQDRDLMLALLALNYVDGPDNAATIRAIARDLERFARPAP